MISDLTQDLLVAPDSGRRGSERWQPVKLQKDRARAASRSSIALKRLDKLLRQAKELARNNDDGQLRWLVEHTFADLCRRFSELRPISVFDIEIHIQDLQLVYDNVANEEKSKRIGVCFSKIDGDARVWREWVMESAAEDLAGENFAKDPESLSLNAHVVERRTAEWQAFEFERTPVTVPNLWRTASRLRLRLSMRCFSTWLSVPLETTGSLSPARS